LVKIVETLFFLFLVLVIPVEKKKGRMTRQ
jgi:hypothetical protein